MSKPRKIPLVIWGLFILLTSTSQKALAQESLYYNDSKDTLSQRSDFVRKKCNGTYVFKVVFEDTGYKRYKIYEKYDSLGRLIQVELNNTWRVDGHNYIYEYAWDDSSRISECIMKWSEFGLFYRYYRKAVYNYNTNTVDVYSYKNGKFVFKGKYKLFQTPTISKRIVWGYQLVD
ncbi:MAG: hypothetical protein ACWA41_06515 [Putridiphycobacter sp.]